MKVLKQGMWDCAVCGHKGNPGPLTRCIKCNASRPEDVKFYLPDDAKIVTNEEEKRKAYLGADWICSYCGSQNKVYENNCQSCGNDREVDEGDKSLPTKETRFDNNKKENTQKTDNKSSKKRSKIKRILLFLLIGFIGFVILSTFSSDINVTIVDKKWSHTIEYKVNKLVQDEDWSLPANAQLIKTYQDIHHYDKIPDGYQTKTRKVKKQVGTKKVKIGQRDLGNGHIEEVYEERPIYEYREETYEAQKYRKKPVYKTKYVFKIKKWINAQPIKTTGNSKQKIIEPRTDTIADEFEVTNEKATYYFEIKDHKGEKHTEKVPLNKWEQHKINEKIAAEKSTIFGFYQGLKK